MNLKILIVGTNPSTRGGIKSPSIRNLYDWLVFIQAPIVCFANVHEAPTDNNRPLKQPEASGLHLLEYTPSMDKIIACGTVASKTLTRLEIDHFKLPHPSPLNRQLNDLSYIKTLVECYEWLQE